MQPPNFTLKRLTAALLAASFLWTPAGAQTSLPDLGDAADASLSESQERTIGKRVMMMIRSDRSYVEDPELGDYIESLGRKKKSTAVVPVEPAPIVPKEAH